MTKTVVDVQVACDETVPPENELRAWVTRALEAASNDHPGTTEVAVRIVDADEMQALNREYRGKDSPTNVLSFPAGDQPGVPGDELRNLGDIVVCAAVVAEEADAQGKTAHAHWAHMLVHGTLHLLGYDHIKEEEAVEMEAQEVRILSEHGITDPYRVQ